MAETTASSKKGERIGEVRCLNCFERFWPPLGTEKAPCPACGFEWYISWSGKLAKVRKPVWESWERQLAQAQRPAGSRQEAAGTIGGLPGAASSSGH